MMPTTFQTIILRFRDLVTEDSDTIKKHQDVIAKNGYVWWGWWKKGNEAVPIPEFSTFDTKAKSTPTPLFLVDSGQGLVFQATCQNVELRDGQKLRSPEVDKTPEYYREQEYYAWFRFTQIEPCDEAVLRSFSYVDCPSLFSDKNIDYSRFNNKKVYSVAELTQQNRTVWFVREAAETDPENEIILLNPEIIQPASFDKMYYQSPGSTLLWLSDLHLSDRRFNFRYHTSRRTLAQHICDCVKDKKIGGLLMTGDITSRAEPEGFDLAKQLLKDLNNELFAPISAGNILLCPGNHDFAREPVDLPQGAEPSFIYDKPENAAAYSALYKSIYNIAPNQYFASGRKILLSSGYLLEIAALNSVILQQYPNFEGHGYLSQEQLDFVAAQIGWDHSENQNAIRIVMMHHHYLPTCYAETIDTARASSVVYDADRLMNWLVKYHVKLLLHGHKHKSFVSQINYPKRPENDIACEAMHQITVIGMGGTGAGTSQNKFAAIDFENNEVVVTFYNIYHDASEKDHKCQLVRLPLM